MLLCKLASVALEGMSCVFHPCESIISNIELKNQCPNLYLQLNVYNIKILVLRFFMALLQGRILVSGVSRSNVYM